MWNVYSEIGADVAEARKHLLIIEINLLVGKCL